MRMLWDMLRMGRACARWLLGVERVALVELWIGRGTLMLEAGMGWSVWIGRCSVPGGTRVRRVWRHVEIVLLHGSWSVDVELACGCGGRAVGWRKGWLRHGLGVGVGVKGIVVRGRIAAERHERRRMDGAGCRRLWPQDDQTLRIAMQGWKRWQGKTECACRCMWALWQGDVVERERTAECDDATMRRCDGAGRRLGVWGGDGLCWGQVGGGWCAAS